MIDMKRLIDIIIALTALLILSPIFILVALKVRRNLGSPIFFYQERPGKNSKLFKISSLIIQCYFSNRFDEKSDKNYS